jgi:hypothetical protein
MTRRLWLLAAALMPYTSPAFAQDQADLAQAAQNPVAAMISLPFQNNTLFGVGPDDDVANVLNIQPVIPFTVGDWNIINRTIVPVIYLPDVTSGAAGAALGRERRQHLRPRRHQPLNLLLAGGLGPGDLGDRAVAHHPDRDRQEDRHPKMERRAGGGGAGAAGAVGDREPGPPAVVIRRRRRPPGRQPAADPAVRQL